MDNKERSKCAPQFLLGFFVSLTTGCAALEKTTYEREFDPPASYLSMKVGRIEDALVSSSMLSEAQGEIRKIGYDPIFVGAVRHDRCNSICYFFRPRYTDDLYIVITANEPQTRLRKWFFFSPLDSGSP